MAGRKLLKRENISPIHIPLAEEEEEGKKKNNNNRIRENTPADSLWLFSFRHPFKKKSERNRALLQTSARFKWTLPNLEK